MFKWAKNLLAGIAFGFATGGKLAAEPTVLAPTAPEHALPLRKRYQGEVTIAGGPGSQKIGETFDRLPPEVKAQFIAARGRGGFNRRSAHRLVERGVQPTVRLEDIHVVPVEDKIGIRTFEDIYAIKDGQVVRVAEPDEERTDPNGGTDARAQEIARDRAGK